MADGSMAERASRASSTPSPVFAGLRTTTLRRHASRLGLDDEATLRAFLEPRLSSLPDPSVMKGRAEAAHRLARAVRAGERIVVFGDYDCDGMTATAILVEGLRELGARDVRPLLASRFDGGYGVSEAALGRILAAEPSVVVTCDCGSSDAATLGVLTARGIDGIVIDHHLVPPEPLPVLAFLNPHQPDCRYPYKGLASCGLAFSVVAALRAELGRPLAMKKWLDLVAIGTIADVAPLTADNRTLVRAGLAELADPTRPGLRALLRVLGWTFGAPRRATDVSFRIAPRLNAPGRLGAPDLALELLLETDPTKAAHLAELVEQTCTERRRIQAEIEQEALAVARTSEASALVLGKPGWNHGIVGIVAGRVASEIGKPTIVVGFEDGTGRGSVRGPAGFPLFDALSRASSPLVRFGGHQAAAGLEVRWERFEEFREEFVSACSAVDGYVRPEPPEALSVEAEDDLAALFADLLAFEPCGEGNPAPRLAFAVTVTSAKEVKGGHLKLSMVLPLGQRVSGFGPGLGARAAECGGPMRVYAEIRPDTFRGDGGFELLVEGLEPLGGAARA